MHVRHMVLHVREGNFDRLINILKYTVIPAAERQVGFASFIVLGDREAGKVVCISMWETEADMLASEREEFFQEQISRVIVVAAGPPFIEHYRLEVLS
jgi:heme-degrading monooxygenase HmoA